MSDSFWIIPEDVQERWAGLTEVFANHSNCWLMVEILVRDGRIEYTSEPIRRNVQPRNLKQTQSNQNWWSVIRQLQAVGCHIRGTALLSLDVLIDSGNSPVVWTEPSIKRLKRP